MGIFGWSGLGFDGIASGTVLAQYSGLACALLLLHFRYRGMFNDITVHDLPVILKSTDRKAFAKMNTDLFVRSLCFIAIYIGYTVISAAYGDLMLASASIMMKLLMLFSYFTDGFAYAGEAMSGKYIGAGNGEKLNATMRWVFVWSVSIALLFIGIYYVAGVPMLRVLSKDEAVIEACRQFLPWLVLMPLLGVIAFTWDGIYVGATATRYIRNTMIWSVAAFFLVWYLGKYILTSHGIATDENCIHMLLAAYFAHLLARSAYQTAIFRKAIVIP